MHKTMISEKVKRKNLIYQMYPAANRTFEDMSELVKRYIHKLRPDYIWLSPIFKSPWIDGGYDVSDYYQVDERFGSLEDFDKFVQTCADYHIGVLLDLPVNHTSTEHDWFKWSVDAKSGSEKYADYYLWMKTPNNWRSMFGGSACKYNSQREEYYLHLFDKTQADLNWRSADVRREFRDIIEYWTEKHSVAGFRVDMCNIIFKKSLKNGWEPIFPGVLQFFQSEETLCVLSSLFSGKSFFTMGEIGGGELYHRKHLRDITDTVLDTAYNAAQMDVFDTFIARKNKIPHRWYKRWIKYFLKWSSEPTHVVMLENHDSPRAVSRFQADPMALAVLQFATPSNTVCIYQGQEIGTKNPILPEKISEYEDIESRRRYKGLIMHGYFPSEAMEVVRYFSRDNARKPVDWREWERQAGRKVTKSVLKTYLKMIDIWRNYPDLQNPDGHSRVTDVCFKKRGKIAWYMVGNLEVKVDLTGDSESHVLDTENDIIVLSTR